MHCTAEGRLLADLDCNGWPQTGRNRALEELRRVRATHLCGDQHLAVVVKHGIREFGDGPYAFTSPALVNTIYGRWWHPEDEQPGPNAVPKSPLPWTGDYRDGLGNRLTMLAYANPPDIRDERQRGDGYGLVRFDKHTRRITCECWPRFADVPNGDQAQFPGWPVQFSMDANDGRRPVGHLPELSLTDVANPVVQVIAQSTGEIISTVRVRGPRYRAPVYEAGKYTVKLGQDKPDAATHAGRSGADVRWHVERCHRNPPRKQGGKDSLSPASVGSRSGSVPGWSRTGVHLVLAPKLAHETACK